MDAKMQRVADRHLVTTSEGYETVVRFTVDDQTHEVRIDQTPADTREARVKSAVGFLVQRLADALCDCDLRGRMARAFPNAGVFSHSEQCRLVRELETP